MVHIVKPCLKKTKRRNQQQLAKGTLKMLIRDSTQKYKLKPQLNYHFTPTKH